MHFATTLLSTILVIASLILNATAQWQITELTTHEMWDAGVVKFNSTVDFSIVRPGKDLTLCSTNWVHWPTPILPKQWIQCENDISLRFRIAVYNDVSNYTLEVVELDPGKKNVHAKTTSIGVTRANITVSTDTGIQCTGQNTNGGTICVLEYPPLNLVNTSSTFTPVPLPIFFSESRSEGPLSGVIPCSNAWTFQMYDPNVATLGRVTLSGAPQDWQTTCESTWACDNADQSIGNWTSCSAPSFQFMKTVPSDGNSISDFVLNIKHTFPLMMATSIRGINASDTQLVDPEEAAGIQVVLTLEETKWKNGTTLTPVQSGGIDQNGNCSLGCEFFGKQVAVKVIDMELL